MDPHDVGGVAVGVVVADAIMGVLRIRLRCQMDYPNGAGMTDRRRVIRQTETGPPETDQNEHRSPTATPTCSETEAVRIATRLGGQLRGKMMKDLDMSVLTFAAFA